MIKEVHGDILLSSAEAIAHGIAPNDHFNQGLALSLREQWPAMYKDFRHFCHSNHPKSGTLWIWSGVGGVRIVNLFTQDPPKDERAHPGKATTSHVNHCLKELRKLCDKEGFKSLALPKLATGVGGLDWNDINPLIQEHLGDLNIPVYVYTEYQKGEMIYHCRKCGLDLNHRIVLMNGNVPARVLCLTCHSERAYREPSSRTKRQVSATPRQKTQAKADLQKNQWTAQLNDPHVTPKKYNINAAFDLEDHVIHPKFGKGLVVGFEHPDKVHLFFGSEVKVLKGLKNEAR